MIQVNNPVYLRPPYIADRWYNPNPKSTTDTILTANKIYLRAFQVERPVVIKGVGVRVTTGSTAGGKFRLGYYYDNGAGVPSALAGVVTAEQDAATPAIIGAALASSFLAGPGFLWFALFTDNSGTPMTCRSDISLGAGTDLQGSADSTAPLSTNSVGLTQSLAYTTFPSTLGSLTQANALPQFQFQAG